MIKPFESLGNGTLNGPVISNWFFADLHFTPCLQRQRYLQYLDCFQQLLYKYNYSLKHLYIGFSYNSKTANQLDFGFSTFGQSDFVDDFHFHFSFFKKARF